MEPKIWSTANSLPDTTEVQLTKNLNDWTEIFLSSFLCCILSTIETMGANFSSKREKNDFVLFSHLFSMSSGYGFYFTMERNLLFSSHSTLYLIPPSFNDSAQKTTYTPKIKIKQNKNQKRSFKERSSTEIVFLLILSTEADFAYNDLIGFQWWYSKSYFGIA